MTIKTNPNDVIEGHISNEPVLEYLKNNERFKQIFRDFSEEIERLAVREYGNIDLSPVVGAHFFACILFMYLIYNKNLTFKDKAMLYSFLSDKSNKGLRRNLTRSLIESLFDDKIRNNLKNMMESGDPKDRGGFALAEVVEICPIHGINGCPDEEGEHGHAPAGETIQ